MIPKNLSEQVLEMLTPLLDGQTKMQKALPSRDEAVRSAMFLLQFPELMNVLDWNEVTRLDFVARAQKLITQYFFVVFEHYVGGNDAKQPG